MLVATAELVKILLGQSGLSAGPYQLAEMMFNLFNSDSGSEGSVGARRGRPQRTCGEPAAGD